MNWFYASNNEQKGPLDNSALDQLFRQGTVTPQTLVWREGMAEWQPYGSITRAPATPPLPGGIICSNCGQSFAPDQVVKLGSGYACAACKPAVLQKMKEGVHEGSPSEQIRQDHIKHEASIKSVGLLYLLGGCGLLLASASMTLFAVGSPGRGSEAVAGVVTGLCLGALGVFQFVTGLALRRLKPWSKIASGILSGLGLLAFPLGTLINAYILYLLFGQKGKTVFSPDYKRVIAETPHIKYRTSIILWILLGLLVALIGFGIFGAAFFSRR